MRKLMIAVYSHPFAECLKQALENRYEIHICTRGDRALELLEALRPDILLLDLSLPKRSGLSILQHTAYKPPSVLAFTHFTSDSVLRDAAAAGVGELLLLPCPMPYILSRLERLPAQHCPTET